MMNKQSLSKSKNSQPSTAGSFLTMFTKPVSVVDPEPTVAPFLRDTLHYYRPTYTSLQSAVLLPVIRKERLCIFYFPNTVTKSCISLAEHLGHICSVCSNRKVAKCELAGPSLPACPSFSPSVCSYVTSECMEFNTGRVTKCANTFQVW